MRDCIYIKECLGKDKVPLKIYKFRTMELNADERLDELVNFDSFGNPIEDFRITEIGRFLRKYWLDELPQLYNLVKGDIKLVGIRPMREIDWQRYPNSLVEKALKQKPGLMGFQYASSNTPSFKDHLVYLEEYLSMWEKNPLKTDREYLSRITKNIVLGGVRSS